MRRSALWAAYGDALGFITELADAHILNCRIGKSEVTELTDWKRRIGGRFGVDLTLPKGCYSDDTQLRLATCRAIRSDGVFDVEAFAKVELPIWRGYALGAGRGTKAAAMGFVKSDTQWSGNFFESQGQRYVDGGGNGAAMRIQPHVWAAKPLQRDSEIVRDIIKNAVTTHGHFRGILGAVFHGLFLLQTIHEQEVPSVDKWDGIIDRLRYTKKIMDADESLATFWMPCWENVTRETVQHAIDTTIGEIVEDVHTLQRGGWQTPQEDQYRNAVDAIGGLQPACRGSGTKTAVLASFLAQMARNDPAGGLRDAVNVLGSDTDTIATMAGAILGVVAENDPPQEVADCSYLEEVTARICAISQGMATSNFQYPDLLFWQPPKAEVDIVGLRNGEYWVAGLGKAVPVGKEVEQKGTSPAIWQWFQIEFGQNVLIKRRLNPRHMPPAQSRPLIPKPQLDRQTDDLTVDEACQRARKAKFDAKIVGTLLLSLAAGSDGTERAAAFALFVAREGQSVK